jgi:hypothetical protein
VSIQTLPNIEALIGSWLREHDDLIALDVNVGPRTPSATTRPWIRVTLINVADYARKTLEYLVTYTLQLDCYAGSVAQTAQTGQREAHGVKATARAVLKAVEGTTADGVYVSKVRFPGDFRSPDVDVGEPARERYILTVEVTAHAVPS